MPRWELMIYPELRRFDERDRQAALARAKESGFDAIEIAGLLVALLFVVALTKYSAIGMGLAERIGAGMANFVVAFGLLAVISGPFYVRRTRRGLRKQLDNDRRTPSP